LLPDEISDGPHNMAADEVMLESAVAGVASFRLYGWSAETLSLGYFQREECRRTDERLASLPFVRRPTGGATLVHWAEVTYALALPAGPPWQPRGRPVADWLTRLHAVVASSLTESGVKTRMVCERAAEERGEILCFQQLTPGDLAIGSNKVVGSAQRRHRGALLQHGAILLAASPHAPVLPGILELTGKNPTALEVSDCLKKAVARGMGWILAEEPWTPLERQRIDVLVSQKYIQPQWNCKR
jgi:lipoate-protein ligase A